MSIDDQPTDPDEPTAGHRDAEGSAEPGAEDRGVGPDEPTAVHPDPAGGGGDPSGDREAPAAAPGAGLHRSASDRMLFGVCGGIAEQYRFEPLLVRLAFLATLFLGGAGVLFYLAAALLIPAAPDDAPGTSRVGGPAVGAAGGVLRLLVGLAVAIAAFAGLCAVAGVSFGLTAFLGAWPVAVVLLVLAALIVASLRSRRATGALLLLALALAVPATAAVVGDVRVDRSAGEREIRPVSISEATRPHRLGVGRMVLDLRRTPIPAGTAPRIAARVDVGELGVVLPRTRCVAWTIRARVRVAGDSDVLTNFYNGEVWTGGGSNERTVEVDPPHGDRDRRPRATLDLSVGVGSLLVADTRSGIDGARGVGVVGHEGAYRLRTAACRSEDRAAGRR